METKITKGIKVWKELVKKSLQHITLTLRRLAFLKVVFSVWGDGKFDLFPPYISRRTNPISI